MKSQKDRVSAKLKERDFKLTTLLEISNAINNLDEDFELFDYYKKVLIEKLHLGKGLLISDINGWSENLRFGASECDINVLVEKCFEYERITVLNDENDVSVREFDVVIPISHKNRVLSYLLLADFEGERIEVSPIIRHLPFIQTLTNLVVVAQENKRLFEESIDRAAMQKELELASRMQNMLIPDHIPERKDIDVHALYRPHQLVGGDYYDFFSIDSNTTAFCIADVSGKGMSAAMLMSNFQAMMHSLLTYDKDLNHLVHNLNERVARSAKGEKFITAFIALFDHHTHELTYVNCGHQPAIFCHEGKVIELKLGSPVLGAFEVLPHLNVGQQLVAHDDAMVCFTDGICEVENEKNREFGTEPIKESLKNLKKSDARKKVDDIMDKILKFKGNRSFSDDLALLAIRFTHE